MKRPHRHTGSPATRPPNRRQSRCRGDARAARHGMGVLLAVLCLALAAGACSDPERLPEFSSARVIDDAIVLTQHVAMLDRSLEEVIVLKPSGAQIEFSAVSTGPDPTDLEVAPDRETLGVLSRGEATLTVIDVPAGSARTYELENGYDSIAFSPDSRFAITFYSPTASRPADTLFNPNEYAVVDLEADPGTDGAVLPRALRGFGDTPAQVWFVPPFELTDGGDPERYAMFLFDSYITFADLQDPAYEITVQLTLSVSDAAIQPREVMFTDSEDAPELQDSFVYMLADNSDDVFAINLLPGLGDDGTTRLVPTINQLPSGDGPRDMAKFIGPEGREKIITVNATSRDFAIIDASTAAVTRIPLEGGGNRVHLFDAVNESTGDVEPHALIYDTQRSTEIVSFVRLMQAEDRLGQAVESLRLDSPVQRLVTSPVPGQVVLVHRGNEGLSLLDLEERAYSPLQARVALSDLELDSNGRRIFASLLGSANLNIIDLATQRPTAIPLDFPIQRLVYLPKTRSLLAFHNDPTGLVTALEVDVVPDDEDRAPAPLTRDDARTYSGYLLDGLLEVEEPAE